jgi:putative acetyltransferase
VRLYERSGYRRRSAFGGYPDNGLSLFYEKSLSS